MCQIKQTEIKSLNSMWNQIQIKDKGCSLISPLHLSVLVICSVSYSDMMLPYIHAV